MNGNDLPASLPEMPEPTAPFVDPIIQIHRGPDAYVSFHRKRDGKWEDIGSLRTSDLRKMFPEFLEELERDGYFSINSFYRPGRGVGLRGLLRAHRRAADARYLNACFAELDVHLNRGLDWGLWLGAIVTGQDRKLIPPASLICRSGRGIWVLWLLRQKDNSDLPPRAFPEQVLLFDAIEQEIIRGLRKVAAEHIRKRKECGLQFTEWDSVVDAGVKDVARVMRVPGSINTNVHPGDPPRVQFWPQLSSSGKGYSYTLEELAVLLGVKPPEMRPNRRRTSEPEAQECGRRGWLALWQQRFDNFETLRHVRGGFREGCRNRAAYIYAVILRGVGFTDAATAGAVTRLGRECRPPLSQGEINGAIEQSKENRRQIRDFTIANYLAVTPDEAAAYVPAWDQQRTLPEVNILDMNMTNTARIEARKKIILETVVRLGSVPSTRLMARLLCESGSPISHVQVSTYYKQLGIGVSTRECSLFTVQDLTLVGREGERKRSIKVSGLGKLGGAGLNSKSHNQIAAIR